MIGRYSLKKKNGFMSAMLVCTAGFTNIALFSAVYNVPKLFGLAGIAAFLSGGLAMGIMRDE